MSNLNLNMHAGLPPFCKTLISAGLSLVSLAVSGALVTANAAVPVPLAGSKPNILYIVADDLGYSDLSAFGGEIRTPNIDSLVQSGRILTNHHVSTVCAVTRSMLYSGTDHHLVGEGTMGAPNDERKGLPGYEGYLNNNSLSIAELLKDGGYHTYISGKWHLGSSISPATTNKTPDLWGFERSFTLLGGAAGNHFGHDSVASHAYTKNGAYVAPPTTDAQGNPWYDTNGYTDQLIAFIDENKTDGKPFAAFATYTSPHWPLQVPEPWLSQYSGFYNGGYDVVRNRRLLRQKQLGLVPNDYTVASQTLPNASTASAASANNGKVGASYINADTVQTGNLVNVDYHAGIVNQDWSHLTVAQKQTQARYMEIYAGMISNLDYNVGRLIQHLKDIGQYDNTYIVFHSDNGAEGWPISSAQDTTNFNNFANLGKDQFSFAAANKTNAQYGLRWAEVSATPFRLVKGFTTEGGTSSPTIVHLPGQTTQYPTLRDFIHIRDAAPTLLELAGIPLPATPSANVGVNNLPLVHYNNRDVYPITGKSFLSDLAGTSTGPVHTEAVGEEQYGRAYLRKGPWKAVWTEPPYGPADGHWQLYNIVTDRAETNDVSASNPSVVNDLYLEWKDYLTHTGGVEPKRPIGYY